jgi:hypothetical protein
LDKIYFEPMITGWREGPNEVSVLYQFSESSMSALQKVLSEQWQRAAAVTAAMSDARSPGIQAEKRSMEVDIDESKSHAKFLEYGFHVERFLDLAYMAFDKTDYNLIREFLTLPQSNFGNLKVLDCDCEEHMEKAKSRNNDEIGPQNFMQRTWPKLVECVKKLGLEGDASEHLKELNGVARALGCQSNTLFDLHLTFSW